MQYNGETKVYEAQPAEVAWRRRLALVPDKPARSGKVQTRIMSNAEAERYDVPLDVVRSARSRKAAATRKKRAAADADRQVQAETVERLMETGEKVTA